MKVLGRKTPHSFIDRRVIQASGERILLPI